MPDSAMAINKEQLDLPEFLKHPHLHMARRIQAPGLPNPPLPIRGLKQMDRQLLEQLNITLRNLVDTYERLGRGSVSLKRSAEQVAERIGIECNVHVRVSADLPNKPVPSAPQS